MPPERIAPTPIRDTAAQDHPLEQRPAPRWRLLALVAGGALLAFAVVALSARWIAGDRWVDGSRLRFAEVTRGMLVRDASVQGRVVAAVSPTVHAPAPGTVTLAIRAGDAVQAGDVLATVESPELASEVERERSTLGQLEAQVGSARIGADRQRLDAQRDADEAAIALTAARRELERAQSAWDGGVISQVDLQRAKDAVETAVVRERNAARVAELAGRSAGFQLASAERQLEQQRLAVQEVERRAEALTVRAPVAGIVGTLSVADRAVVPKDAPLMTLVDLSRLEVELEVPETYADDLGLGMKAEVKLGTTTAIGTLAALSPEVVASHVLARVRFDGEQPPGLRQSQRVSARILIEERPDVLMVPRGSFLEAHGGAAVYVVDGDRATRRAIRTGASSVTALEILDGLSEGERVVVAGSDTFEDAESVRIEK